ncbi:MAG: hypothetical protein WCK90_01865 [archaeon]
MVDITRREVEAKLASVGDYVKMDFLQQCLKKQTDFDTKKFVLNTLADIYVQKKMFVEAARLMRVSADINTSFGAKIEDYMKSADLYIKSGAFAEADMSLMKALAEATPKQKSDLKIRHKNNYKSWADELLAKDKRKNAMDAYAKFLTLPEAAAHEKYDAQLKLVKLYERLGKITEFSNLRKSMPTHAPAAPAAPPRKIEITAMSLNEKKRGFFSKIFGL